MPRKKKNFEEGYFMPFPSRLREIMEDRNKHQQDVSEHIGTTRQMVGRYKDGSTFPDVLTLTKLCEYFNVSADWFLGLESARTIDIDIKTAVNTTGLTENAIHSLQSLCEEDPFTVVILSRLIEDADTLAAVCRYLSIKNPVEGSFIIDQGGGIRAEKAKAEMRTTDIQKIDANELVETVFLNAAIDRLKSLRNKTWNKR